jgi:hypothetical protein
MIFNLIFEFCPLLPFIVRRTRVGHCDHGMEILPRCKQPRLCSSAVKLPRLCDDAHVALVPGAVSLKSMVQREHLTENLSTVWTIVVRVTLVAFFTKFGFPRLCPGRT